MAAPGEAGSVSWPHRADLVVIGAGLTGLSAAYHALVARPGARVVVLEAERVGHGASSRSTGMLTPGVGQDLAALVRRCGAETARQMYQRSLEAVRYVEHLSRTEHIDAGLEMTGQLVVACGPSGRRRMARQADALEILGLPVERLDNAGLEQRLRIQAGAEGGDGVGPAALRLPVAGTLHPGRLLRGLSDAICKRGGIIVEGARVAQLSRELPVRIALEDGRELVAAHTVVATSGYSGRLNPHKGRLVPLHLRVLLTEPLSARQLSELNWHGREGVIDSRRLFNYLRLTEDNRILFGGGPPRYAMGGGISDRTAIGPDLDRLVCQLRGFFPTLHDLPIARSWTGVIAYSLDTLPVIGNVPGYEGVTFVGGWCGHGIALGVTSGLWVQKLLANGTPPEALPWFRQRPPLAPPDPLRWLAVQAATSALALMDRW
jgi:glycine/D-amino acid oxidase-like deaminating enzyme